MDYQIRPPNHLLLSLPPDDFRRLLPHLRETPMPHKQTLVKCDDPITRAFFPLSGVISLVATLAAGEMVEVAMIGRDSVLGAAAALGRRTSLNAAIVQIPGAALTIDIAILSRLATESPSLRRVLGEHLEFVFAQVQQAAVCNASHTLEARLARWLLRIHDLDEERKMLLTQDFLGQMMGVQRSSVSTTANALQQAGLISYRRGQVEITNLEGLKAITCECYATIRQRSQQLMPNASVEYG